MSLSISSLLVVFLFYAVRNISAGAVLGKTFNYGEKRQFPNVKTLIIQNMMKPQKRKL